MDSTLINPVVLIGGTGTRLWPLSRANHPKQFSKFMGKYSLFQQNLLRLNMILNLGRIYLVVGESNYFICLEQLRELSIENVHIIVEPIGKNTAPAVAVAAHHIAAQKSEENLLLVLPSDHLIKNVEAFAKTVRDAAPQAVDKLVLFGVQPTIPATGYGYIQAESGATLPAKVVRFIEKPNLERAKVLMETPNCFWNSGMFFFSVKTILAAFDQYAPEINLLAKESMFQAMQQGHTFYLPKQIFSDMPSIPLDIAVMEKTDNAFVFQLQSDWSDLGDWNAVYEGESQDSEGNVCIGKVMSLSTRNSYLHSDEKLLATIGVDNLVVVSAKDSVLIANKNQVQDVKQLVDMIKSSQYAHMANHDLLVHRPWGSYESIIQMENFQVKHIIVKPGGTLSLQLHYHRSEHWIVVKGIADVVCGEEAFQVFENQSTYIPKETKHRLVNLQETPLHLIEVQVGAYLGENDIVRFEDVYGRVSSLSVEMIA